MMIECDEEETSCEYTGSIFPFPFPFSFLVVFSFFFQVIDSFSFLFLFLLPFLFTLCPLFPVYEYFCPPLMRPTRKYVPNSLISIVLAPSSVQRFNIWRWAVSARWGSNRVIMLIKAPSPFFLSHITGCFRSLPGSAVSILKFDMHMLSLFFSLGYLRFCNNLVSVLQIFLFLFFSFLFFSSNLSFTTVIVILSVY